MADPAGVREAGPALGPRGERGDSCDERRCPACSTASASRPRVGGGRSALPDGVRRVSVQNRGLDAGRM